MSPYKFPALIAAVNLCFGVVSIQDPSINEWLVGSNFGAALLFTLVSIKEIVDECKKS